ncbi:MAG: sterol desaturase family protein [Saprospiraceae bacterium]|nr:sterol desaturase family protein [Saprospiraceae bacterium]MCF8250159.1 sterol desaturase family protein [Saprospiraceae bacterium]MCF8279422.1 sterol desaturase family protein [Bacteroidales bacterium]MCF8311213.1 sterol desaturase family protein [Saprospiraceae bacterium]MCF8440407.1 sterol desaturase family protein [Saprospiraceae bacterium]
MEAYAQALTIAIPIFFLLILLEELAARLMGRAVNRSPDMVSSLSSGVTNVVKDVLGLSIAIVTYAWMVEHLAIFTIKSTLLVFVVAFVAKDFAGYWLHRWEHTVNFLWNRHIIHHSSEEFNLSCALRQSISEVFQIFTFLMLPAALLGVPTEVVAVVGPIQLFAQFWYHTRLIGKMGPLEAFLVTPSHHRVHHAMNGVYLDKNYGQIFIIWDRMFGTFQPELADVPPIFGVKRPVHTWNPILIGWQHFWLLLTDAWRTLSWWDKLRLWFKPTGWRPADVAAAYPVAVLEDFEGFEKYDTHLSSPLKAWAWVQLFSTLSLMFYLFNQIAAIGFPGIFWYGGFLFVSIFSYTTLMDKSRWAVLAEVVRVIFGLLMIWWQGGDWFGLGKMGTDFIVGCLLFSLAASVYFSKTEIPVKRQFAEPV